MTMASETALGDLYRSTYDWVRQNGEPEVEPSGRPVEPSQGYRVVELTGNEVWGIAPEAARTLSIDGTQGSFNIAAGAPVPDPLEDLEGPLVQNILFTVEFPPDGPMESVTYGIDDPAAGEMSPTTEREFTGLDREFLRMKGGLAAKMGMSPEQRTSGIEDNDRQALQQVVDALVIHWPAIVAARRQQ